MSIQSNLNLDVPHVVCECTCVYICVCMFLCECVWLYCHPFLCFLGKRAELLTTDAPRLSPDPRLRHRGPGSHGYPQTLLSSHTQVRHRVFNPSHTSSHINYTRVDTVVLPFRFCLLQSNVCDVLVMRLIVLCCTTIFLSALRCSKSKC